MSRRENWQDIRRVMLDAWTGVIPVMSERETIDEMLATWLAMAQQSGVTGAVDAVEEIAEQIKLEDGEA